MAGRKIGRNKKTCENYKNNNRREKNKVVKVQKHLTKHPEDKQSVSILTKLIDFLGGRR